jgi:hypothetical protein
LSFPGPLWCATHPSSIREGLVCVIFFFFSNLRIAPVRTSLMMSSCAANLFQYTHCLAVPFRRYLRSAIVHSVMPSSTISHSPTAAHAWSVSSSWASCGRERTWPRL